MICRAWRWRKVVSLKVENNNNKLCFYAHLQPGKRLFFVSDTNWNIDLEGEQCILGQCGRTHRTIFTALLLSRCVI